VVGSDEKILKFHGNKYPDSQEYASRFRIPSGCAILGIMDEQGETFGGGTIIDGISMMRERSNGLGGGFAAYGIYPEFKNDWAFHIFYDDITARKQTENELAGSFKVLYSEEIPTKRVSSVKNPPIIYRYFLKLKNSSAGEKSADGDNGGPLSPGNGIETEEDFIVDLIMKVNRAVKGAYIISSGKNMGIFKGVGFPEDIGRFFALDEYKAYTWTSHGRFPTNSVGWWGGAHPFGLLNWSVVHNGEISSYGTNKRFVSSFGYECTLSTDTEVIAYLFDLLVRKMKIKLELIHLILAAPLWEEIDRMAEDKRELIKSLRVLYGSALVNGPFSIIAAGTNFMYALNDRMKLRPMVSARKGDLLFVSSEEAPIKKICPSPDLIWRPSGGEPVIGILKNTLKKEEQASSKAIC
jgi:glutamate synthase domain-containing protein 1